MSEVGVIGWAAGVHLLIHDRHDVAFKEGVLLRDNKVINGLSNLDNTVQSSWFSLA